MGVMSMKGYPTLTFFHTHKDTHKPDGTNRNWIAYKNPQTSICQLQKGGGGNRRLLNITKTIYIYIIIL